MHHHTEAVGVRVFSAVLMGERLALLFAAFALMAIFWLPAVNYFQALRIRRAVVLSDQLGAGIWLGSVGMVVTDLVRLALVTFWHGDVAGFQVAPAMMAIGVFIILLGYGLHFFSWAAFKTIGNPAFRRLSFYWTVGLALVIGAGTLWAMGLS